MARPAGVIVLQGAGVNCDLETLHAWRLAGAEPQPVHVNALLESPSLLDDAQILTLPGGFSYGDDIAAGAILAARLEQRLAPALRAFVDDGKLILGICNGFQVLVKMGLLPGGRLGRGKVSLAANSSGRFEDRWIRMAVVNNQCPFLRRATMIEAPIAHAEGRVVVDSEQTLANLRHGGHVALRYVDASGQPADYPANPNGSMDAIAGLVDDTGRVLGLMPHPERHVDYTQHPLWTRRSAGENRQVDGLDLFVSAVQYVVDSRAID